MNIISRHDELFCKDCATKASVSKADGLLNFEYEQELQQGSFSYWKVVGLSCQTCGRRWRISFSTIVPIKPAP